MFDKNDESCTTAMNQMFDGLIDGAIHMKEHHLDDLSDEEREDKRVIIVAITIASAFSDELVPGLPSPIAVMSWSQIAVRMAERGMEQELRDTHALLSGPGYDKNMKSMALRMAIEAALSGLDSGQISVTAQPGSGDESRTVSLDEMPPWLREVFEQPHED